MIVRSYISRCVLSKTLTPSTTNSFDKQSNYVQLNADGGRAANNALTGSIRRQERLLLALVYLMCQNSFLFQVGKSVSSCVALHLAIFEYSTL